MAIGPRTVSCSVGQAVCDQLKDNPDYQLRPNGGDGWLRLGGEPEDGLTGCGRLRDLAAIV